MFVLGRWVAACGGIVTVFQELNPTQKIKITMTKKILTFLPLGLIAGAVGLQGTILTVATDNFENATFDSETGVLSSTLTYGPLIRIDNPDNVLFGLGETGGNPGQYLSYGHNAAGTTSFFTANLPSTVSLSEVGDWAQISLDFRDTSAGGGNRTLRFGLFESGATIDAAQGFFVAGGRAGGGASRLAADLDVTSNQFMIDGPSVSTGNVDGANVARSVWTSAFLRIERTAANQYTLTSTYGELTFDPFVITTASDQDFELDQVWIGIRARGNTMDIDNLVVTAIPEPRVYAALLGLFALGFVIWRRRRS